MAVDKSLMSGSMTMLLLRLLAEKDMYGYEMIDTLRKKSCNVFELKAGDHRKQSYQHDLQTKSAAAFPAFSFLSSHNKPPCFLKNFVQKYTLIIKQIAISVQSFYRFF